MMHFILKLRGLIIKKSKNRTKANKSPFELDLNKYVFSKKSRNYVYQNAKENSKLHDTSGFATTKK